MEEGGNGEEIEADDKTFSSAMATTCPPPQATLRIRTGHIPIVRVRAIELRMVPMVLEAAELAPDVAWVAISMSLST